MNEDTELIRLLKDMLWLLGSARFKIEFDQTMGCGPRDTRFTVRLTVFHPEGRRQYSRTIPARYAHDASYALMMISNLVKEAERQHRDIEIDAMRKKAKMILQDMEDE